MSFADELLELAMAFEWQGSQAVLRRTVSTAYYALFHLLIHEAVGKWEVERHRALLVRTFDHAGMRAVCDTTKSGATTLPQLQTVARNFTRLQQHRITADYDNSVQWFATDTMNAVILAHDAFEAWREIRVEIEAQDFLLQLFLPKLPRR